MIPSDVYPVVDVDEVPEEYRDATKSHLRVGVKWWHANHVLGGGDA